MIHLHFIIIGLLVTFLSGDVPVSENPDIQNPLHIQARPIHSFDLKDVQRCIFGSLKFRGGLELSSPDERFGGISAILLQQEGTHFLALSDRAFWVRGRIVYEGDKPSAIADAAIAPVLGPDGKHAQNWDTESMTLNGDRLYVGIEGFDKIVCFHNDLDKFPVFRDTIVFPPGLKDLPRNQGIEALSHIPGKDNSSGTLVAFSERGLDKDGNLLAYLIQDSEMNTFAVKRSGEYDISDAVFLPPNELLILERKYNVINGVSMRIRRLNAENIKPDTIVDGPVVVEADIRYEVDNMEAIGMHRDSSGDIVLTLVSDDNYASIQRTLLLQFTLLDK